MSVPGMTRRRPAKGGGGVASGAFAWSWLGSHTKGSGTGETHTVPGADYGDAPTGSDVRRIAGIVYGVGGVSQTVISVTVSGITAKLRAQAGSNGCAVCIFDALVPTGASGDIVVTWDGAPSTDSHVEWGRLMNAFFYDFDFQTAAYTDGQVDAVSGGLTIGGSASNQDTTVSSWTGLGNVRLDISSGGFDMRAAWDTGLADETDRTITDDNGSSIFHRALCLATYFPMSANTAPPATNLFGWWEANEVYDNVDPTAGSKITVDGTAVHSWKDLSGNNRHLSQATASRRATFATNELGAQPSVSFDGSDDWYSYAQALPSSFSAYTVVSVAAGAGDRDAILSGTSGAEKWLGVRTGSPDKIQMYAGSWQPSSGTDISNDTYILVGCAYENVAGDNTTIVIDDDTPATGPAGTSGATGDIRLGGYSNSSTYTFTGNIAAMVVYDTPDADLDIKTSARVRNWLNSEYNLGLDL